MITTKRPSFLSLVATVVLINALWLSAAMAAVPDDFPLVPDDVEVALYAKEPLVRNPCAITFDRRGLDQAMALATASENAFIHAAHSRLKRQQ